MPWGDTGTPKQTLLPQRGGAGALLCFWVAAVSEELFKGKNTCTFLSTIAEHNGAQRQTMLWSRRILGGG